MGRALSPTEPRDRILTVIRLELLIELRVLLLHLQRLLEERLGDDGEELGGVGRAVFVDDRFPSGLQLLVLLGEHTRPRRIVRPA